MDDQILIIDDEDLPQSAPRPAGWKVMIVDDEPEVHRITKITLNKFEFDGKPIDFLHAYSAAEAKALLAPHPGCRPAAARTSSWRSIIPGLEVVKFVRDELQNKMVRIVLRTGQPGQAPEDDVVTNYDINDYKDKTELTSQKLRTLLRASLRSYRDIRTLESNRRGWKGHRGVQGDLRAACPAPVRRRSPDSSSAPCSIWKSPRFTM